MVTAAQLDARLQSVVADVAANYQPADDRLEDIVGAGTDGLLEVVGGAISQRKVGVDTGTSVISRDAGDARYQALDALLSAVAALTTAADQVVYATGSDTVAMAALGAWVRTNFLPMTSSATARTALGLGAVAVLDTIASAQLQDEGVTLAKHANLAQGTTIGRATGAGTGAPVALTGAQLATNAGISTFGATLVDDADAATARTTLDVRSPHVYTIWAGPTVNWAVPSAETLFLGSAPWSCRPYDGTRATQARITACHSGAASSGSVHLTVKYTTNGQAAGTYNTVGTWTQLGASAQVVLTLGTGAGANYLDSGWINIASGAKIDGMVAVTGDGGNGSTSVTFYSVNVEFR